jgi:hypothetical protein
VNTYEQQLTADDKTIVFVSEAIENIPAGYRARETYTILSRGEFTERFDIAEPGKDFELYSEARFKRVNASPVGDSDRSVGATGLIRCHSKRNGPDCSSQSGP